MKGSCLCGAVSLEAKPHQEEVAVCHCGMCRHWAGGPFVSFQANEEEISAEGPVKTFASSGWAERAFCGECGSALWYRLTNAGPMTGTSYVAAGLFDEAGKLPMAHEIYIDRKPEGYSFAGDHPRMTEAEVTAMIQQALGGDGA